MRVAGIGHESRGLGALCEGTSRAYCGRLGRGGSYLSKLAESVWGREEGGE